MKRLSPQQAYPGIAFRPRTTNWWARLKGVPPECVHLETDHDWIAAFLPDTLFQRGKAVVQRRPARPEVCLCRACCLGLLREELAGYAGRVVAFEPDEEIFSQYFFVAAPDFDAAGLKPEVARAIEARLAQAAPACEECARRAAWLLLSRREVASLDESELIRAAPGRRLCAAHGAVALCAALEGIGQANLFYLNVPYGEAGAYLWI